MVRELFLMAETKKEVGNSISYLFRIIDNQFYNLNLKIHLNLISFQFPFRFSIYAQTRTVLGLPLVVVFNITISKT